MRNSSSWRCSSESVRAGGRDRLGDSDVRADLVEIYDLRRLLEQRAARRALPHIDADAIERIEQAAKACADAAEIADVAGELAANRRFHLAILEPCGLPHLMRIIRNLWDSTEAYRAIYYNLPEERTASLESHDEILAALREQDVDRLIHSLNAHRDRALEILKKLLA